MSLSGSRRTANEQRGKHASVSLPETQRTIAHQTAAGFFLLDRFTRRPARISLPDNVRDDYEDYDYGDEE
eukprot:9228857-Pyramimonas_sp.AAC.1